MSKDASAMKIIRDDIQPTLTTDMLASQQATDARNKDLREAAAIGIENLRARREAEAAGISDEAGPPEIPLAPREQVESVLLAMPNGKEVEYGPRRTSTALAFAQLFGNKSPNAVEYGLVTTLMWVREIDGEKVLPPASLVDVQKLANELGDEGIEILSAARNRFWPSISTDDLPVLKKNLR